MAHVLELEALVLTFSTGEVLLLHTATQEFEEVASFQCSVTMGSLCPVLFVLYMRTGGPEEGIASGLLS